MIDIEQVKASANIVAVVGHYTPLQKKGHQWVGKCVAHEPDNNPSMYVVPAKGLIKCFSCGFAEDVIGFIQHVESCGFREAAEKLGGKDEWKPTLSVPAQTKRANRITSKPPLGEPAPNFDIRGFGRPTQVWQYKDADGTTLGFIARYDGDKGKEYRPWTWGARPGQEEGWACGQWSGLRPIYGLADLAKRPTAPVLIVEGEKAADAAATLLPAYVVVTWPGGAEAVGKVEWEPLAGRRVLIWPDADRPGLKAADIVGRLLADPAGLACQVEALKPDGQPEGWDAADAVAEGWDQARLVEWARPRKVAVDHATGIVQPAPDAAEPAEPETPHTEVAAPPEIAAPAAPAKAARPVVQRKTPGKPNRPVLAVVDGQAVRQPDQPPDEDDDQAGEAFGEWMVADEFCRMQKDDLRYVEKWKKWLVWNGARWQLEENRAAVLQRLRALCYSLRYRPEAAGLTTGSRKQFISKKYAINILDLAQADALVIATPSIWDADPWLLGTPGGTVDLRLGKLIEAEREHYLTRQTTVTPADGPTPLFDSVIACASGGDPDMATYIWRWLGYLLTGSCREECFLFLYGKPQSGKTTLIEAVAGILGKTDDGGYSTVAEMDLFTESKLDRGMDRLARLYGARFAYASETEEGRHWKASLLKLATGGDTLQGRRLYENAFTWQPSHKIWIFGNSRPHMRAADDGIKRRLHLLEYAGAISDAERDNTLKARLVEEYPAILHKMIAGCLDWQRCDGLKPPTAISNAVQVYFEAEDLIGAWLEEKTVASHTESVGTSEAYQSYVDFVIARGERAPTQKRFSMAIQSHGFKTAKVSGVRSILGFRFRKIYDDPMPPIGEPF